MSKESEAILKEGEAILKGEGCAVFVFPDGGELHGPPEIVKEWSDQLDRFKEYEKNGGTNTYFEFVDNEMYERFLDRVRGKHLTKLPDHIRCEGCQNQSDEGGFVCRFEHEFFDDDLNSIVGFFVRNHELRCPGMRPYK